MPASQLKDLFKYAHDACPKALAVFLCLPAVANERRALTFRPIKLIEYVSLASSYRGKREDRASSY